MQQQAEPKSSFGKASDGTSRRDEIRAAVREAYRRTPAQKTSETLHFLHEHGVPLMEAVDFAARVGLHAGGKPSRRPGGRRRVSRRVASEIIKVIGDELNYIGLRRPRCARRTTAPLAQARKRSPHRQTASSRRSCRRGKNRAGPSDPDDPEPAGLTARPCRQTDRAAMHG